MITVAANSSGYLDLCLNIRHSVIQAIERRKQMESAKVGKRGAIVVPARLRARFGIEEGMMVTAEEREDGILIRPAIVVPVEKYTPARKAEFLLSNAITPADYKKARKEVAKLGLDPDAIPHRRPA
jgi:AbrB family looped-hinge helix DNA binding protein